jgi:hypothetical protein
MRWNIMVEDIMVCLGKESDLGARGGVDRVTPIKSLIYER